MTIKAAILVVSDRVSAGERADKSGPEAVAALGSVAEIVETCIVPDERDRIRDQLIAWSDGVADVIFTLGGTGLSPRDVTPEATRTVVERELPAMATALVMNGLSKTSRAMLSRAVVGQCGRCLIVNLPGSPKAVRESLDYLRDVLPHAVEMMHGGDHPEP